MQSLIDFKLAGYAFLCHLIKDSSLLFSISEKLLIELTRIIMEK